jgi:predicted RNA-binding protein
LFPFFLFVPHPLFVAVLFSFVEEELVIRKIALAITALTLCVSTVSADLFMYGDLVGDDVMYLDIQEDTRMTPNMLFGAPDISGNKLDFDPTMFTAGADGSNPSQITDAQLNFTLMSNDNSFAIEQVIIEENGDFTLTGLGNAQALATVGTAVNFTILELNGMPAVVPDGSAVMTFTPDGSGEFSLDDEGISTAEPWAGVLNIDISQFLIDNNIDGFATKIEFAIDNTLTAAAADGGAAFIAKKDFNGVTITIPEPSSLVLFASMLVGLAGYRRVR